MRYRISQLKTDPFKVAAEGGGIDRGLLMEQLEKLILRAEARETGDAGKAEVRNISIVRESVDARKKPHVSLVYTVDFDCDTALPVGNGSPFREAVKTEYAPVEFSMRNRSTSMRPVVAGFGPCGMFAGLILAEAGLDPVILERGKPVDERVRDVEGFWRALKEDGDAEAAPDPQSNVQFGEGGAGTFSDGKLTTGIKDVRVRKVLEEFVAAGAPEDILYKHKPHIGTDRLRDVVKNMRHRIQSLGGEVRFGSRLEGMIIEGGRLKGVKVSVAESEAVRSYVQETDNLILAMGHSARDTFEMLYESGFDMRQKAFSMGVRIQHPQKMIDRAQYGNPELAKILGPADYKLSYRCREDSAEGCAGRGVYTFCMCPGGEVVNASTEPGTSVTNGMSNSARDGMNANSAVLVDVRTGDFAGSHPLEGIEFQKKYEKLAWENRTSCGMARTTYGQFGEGSVRNSIPDFAFRAITEAMPVFGKKLRGFDREDAVMTAVESRSSSPVRVLRDENMNAMMDGIPVQGVIPAGEGPGYAGGIMSAAVDGIRAAEMVIRTVSKTCCRPEEEKI